MEEARGVVIAMQKLEQTCEDPGSSAAQNWRRLGVVGGVLLLLGDV